MTVRELIQLLLKEDPEAMVLSAGPDCGGYDFSFGQPGVEVSEEGRVIVWFNGSDEICRPIQTKCDKLNYDSADNKHI